MEHFTREWASGDLSDQDFDAIAANYSAYLGALEPESAVAKFATSISLHDAWIDRVEQNCDALALTLLTGDLQRGYWFTTLRYQGPKVLAGLAALQEAARRRPTEIWYDEFGGSPPSVHRFLLVEPGGTADRGEVHIEFAGFEVSQRSAGDRALEPIDTTPSTS